MDAAQIRRLEPLLDRFLFQFDDCFGRSDTRGHLPVYVRGQMSNLPRKSVEPMALAAGIPPRTLQQFLSLLDWDHGRMRDRLQQIVVGEHASPHSVGIFDETGCPKKGTKTPGVQRQYCGASGKVENCVVTVHLSYAVDDFHCLLDSDLFLSEGWAADRDRCREAGIPDGVSYRPKWRIALELYDRAVANGMQFAWLTFDEGYGGKPELLRELRRRGQRYVAEVPASFTGWLKPQRLTDRPRRDRAGRRRRRLRIVGNRRGTSVAHLLRYSPALRDQRWRAFHVKDGQQGPMVWEVKHVRFFPKTAEGDPGRPLHLVVARNVLKRDEVKFFVSNAPPETPLQTLLLVAFSRWHVERCFEDEKTELGFDHYEGRNYTGLIRHQIVTAVTHLFLARVHQAWRGEKPGTDGVPTADGGGRAGAVVVVGRTREPEAAATDARRDPAQPAPERQEPRQPHQADAAKAPRRRHPIHRPSQVSVG